MEDKLSSKESHVWTLSDFIERRKDWDQGDEARLAEYLQQLSNKITQGAKNTLNELDDLVASIDDTAIQVANINNEFQLLADKQFIENKVQEEDETVQNKIEKPAICEINDADLLVNNIKEALRNSFKAIDFHFEKITVVVSDSDDDDAEDELKHEEIVLRPKIFYKNLNLPLLSGNIQSEIIIDNMSSDSDVDPPMDTFKDQESFSSNDEPEEDTHSLNESKSGVEPNHQTVDTQINFIEPEHFEPKIVSTDAPYIESDLFSPPPLLNDNDEDDLADEYNIFSNGSNMFGERNLWDDNDDDDDVTNFEPPLPIYTDEPPQPVIKYNAQEKVPSIQQTLNDELRKRFHKDNVVSSSDNENIDSPKIKLPIGAVNVLGGTNQKSPSTAQNIKQATISQISQNVAEPIQYSGISDVNNDIIASNKLFDYSCQNADTSRHKNVKEEIKPIKKQSFFEQESDDEDLFAKKSNNVIPFLKSDKPKQRESPINNVKESKTLFSQSDEEFMDSKSTVKKNPSHSIDNKSTKLQDSSSDDDLFNVKSSNYKSIMKQNLNPLEPKLKSQVDDKNYKEIVNKELIDQPKENSTESCVMDYNEIIEKESIRNNNTLSNILVISSTNNKSKNCSYLFSSDEDDDIFFDADESNKNSKKKDHLVSNSTKLVKNRNEKPYESKVELFDSSSDDEIFNTNKSNNNFTYKKSNKQSDSNKGKNITTSESLVNHRIIKEIPEAKNEDKKNLIGKNVINKKHTKVFSLESDDDDDDDYYSSTNNSDGFKISSDKQNVNDNVKSMSLSSEEYLSPLSERKDVFNDFPVVNIFNSKHPESLNEKGIDIPQNETSPNFIENTNEDNRFIFSSSDDEQQLSFNSVIRNVKPNTEIKVIHSTLDSLSWNLPISKNQELSNDKETDTPKNETLSNSTENVIQDKNSSISSSSDDEQQLFLNSNIQNEESNNEIVIRPTLDSLPASLPIIKNEESLNKKEISTAKNETSPSSNQNKIQDKSSIFSSSKDEQQLSYNTNIENKKSMLTKVIGPTLDSKISLQDSVDGSSFSSLNSMNDKTKKLPGKLSVNAGAFINVASLLPNSKSQLNKSNISQTIASDEKNDATLPTSGTKLFSAEKERARIQVKRRPPSRKARQARMSSIDIDQGSNSENSSLFNISTSDFVNCQSRDTQKEGNLEVNSKNQVQSNNKLYVTYNDKINEVGGNSEINNKVKEKGSLDLFNDDSDPFESIQEDKSTKDFCNDNTEIKIVEKQLESKLLTDQLSDIVVNKKQQVIESDCENLLKTEPKNYKQVNAHNMEGIVGNNSKEKTQSTLLPTKSSSLFDEEEDIFSEKSKKVNKLSSNIFDSDDEFEFNHKFTKKNSIKTKSIFGDDSDDDLFSTPSKPTVSNLSNQKQIDKLNQRQNRSSTDGYVKLTAESVAINPLAESKNN